MAHVYNVVAQCQARPQATYGFYMLICILSDFCVHYSLRPHRLLRFLYRQRTRRQHGGSRP